MPKSEPGSGGLSVPQEMLSILRQDGYISNAKGSQTLTTLHSQQSVKFDPSLLDLFALGCFVGELDKTRAAIDSGSAPDLSGTATPFKLGYATLVVLGAQRLVGGPPGSSKHAEVLQYLISHGVPVDVPDILGYTALHHVTMNKTARLDLARILLQPPARANVNHRDRLGRVPLFSPLMMSDIDTVNLLMEFGADMNVADANGVKPASVYLTAGPHITATVTKWLRKRDGIEAPMDGRTCGNPRCIMVYSPEQKVSLRLCARCHTIRYCSKECQGEHWPDHKTSCKSYSRSDTVTLKPFYQGMGTSIPTLSLIQQYQGLETKSPPSSHMRASHVPKSKSKPRGILIKVQVAMTTQSDADLRVYTEKRDLVCDIRRIDNPSGYDRLAETVRTKGVMGLKAYFAAEMRSKDELVVKISEVLAEQPF